MLTRCPACETHFRVTPEQLKVRSGRVRCGECQHVFNALDSLIEEPKVVIVPPLAATLQNTSPAMPSAVAEAAAPPAPTAEAEAEEYDEPAAAASNAELPSLAEPAVATEPEATVPETVEAEPPTESELPHWSETFPEPAPAPRRWPWILGSVLALAAIGLQALLSFRVELAVLWPETRPVLVALCDIADCDVGLPAKVGLVGIEASDLHPDNEHPGRLALTATLKNRAPFAQRFPHLELTLTDTADKAIARKVLTPADYLPPQTLFAQGMLSNADVALAVGIDPGELAASGYRLYLFYP